MEFRNWNVLSFLNSYSESWLSSSSIFFNVNSSLIHLCGLGLLLLLLCCLLGVPSLFNFWKTRKKCQVRAKRRRKGGTHKGWSDYQRDIEEERKLISILKSPPGRKHDSIRFRRLLCPDPSCEVCNTATSEISQLLFPEVLEDASLFVSPLASTALVADSSPTLSPASSVAPAGDLIPSSLLVSSPPPLSIPSPNPVTPLDEFLAPSPLGYSLPPEPFPLLDSQFPVTLSSPKSPPFPPPLPHSMQRVDPALQTGLPVPLKTMYTVDPIMFPDVGTLSDLAQTVNPAGSYTCQQAPPTLPVLPAPDCTLTVTQSQSVSILLKPVQEKPSADSAGGLCAYVPAMTGIDHSSLSISQFSLWQAHAKKLFCSTLPQGEFNQEFLALHSSETSFGGNPAANLVETVNISFLSPEVLALLEKHIQNKINFLIRKEKEKRDSLLKQLKSEYQLNTSGEMTNTVVSKADSAVSLSFLNNEGKPEELQVHEQSQHQKTLQVHSQQKHFKFFWGLPTLHSESLSETVHFLGDLSSVCIFNGIPNYFTEQIPPVPPQPLPLSLPEVQPPPSPQTLLQSQSIPVPEVESLDTFRSLSPVLLSSSVPQMRVCGVTFLQTQEEPASIISPDIQNCLEWHVLKKQQDNLWGSSSMAQKPQEEFCPSPPKSPAHCASQVHASISILPGEFPLSKELEKILEHHLKKRLIQHHWGLPRRIHESLSFMLPPSDFSDKPKSEKNHEFSEITMHKCPTSQSLTVGLSNAGSFHETNSELEEDVGKSQGQILEKRSNKHLLNDLEKSSDQDLRSNSEKTPNYTPSHSGRDSKASEESLHQKKLENALISHLSKKLVEINTCQFPNTVHSSWHAIQQTVLEYEKSNRNVNQSNVCASVDCSLNTYKNIKFINCTAQEMLDSHIQRFHQRMTTGLPSRVLESIYIFTECSSSSSNLPPLASVIPEGDSKSGNLKDLRGNSQDDQMGMKNVGSVFDSHIPVISAVSNEGQGILRQSPDNNQELAEAVQGIKGDKPNLKKCQRQSSLLNRNPTKLPSRQAGDIHEPKFKSICPTNKLEMTQQKMIENKELFSNVAISREIFRAKELDALQSQTSDILTKCKSGRSPTQSANERKAASTKRLPRKISVLPDTNSPELKEQLIDELKLKLKSREQQLAQGQLVDMSSISDSLTHEILLTKDQHVFTGNVGASQEDESGISVEQEKELWVPGLTLRCQDKDFPPTIKSASHPGSKTSTLGGGDAEQASPQHGSRHFPSKYIPLKVYESKNSKLSSQKGQPPPENLFRQKLKDLWQRIYPGTKCMKQNSQVKGSSISSSQDRGPIKSRAATTRKTDTQKYINDTCKPLDKKVGHRHANYITSLQKPPPSVKSGTKQKTEVKAQKESVQEYPFKPKASSSNVINSNSHPQVPLIASQANSASQGMRGTDRHFCGEKAFKNSVVCPRHGPKMLHKGPMPPSTPLCRWHAGQCSHAVNAERFAFRDMSLQRDQFFRQKIILQGSQAGKVSS